MAEAAKVPKSGDWPGAFEAFKLVREYVKPRIWDFVTVIGIGIAIDLILQTAISIAFKHDGIALVLNYIVGLLVAAFMQATLVTMYFDVLNNKEFSLGSAINYGTNRLLKMAGLIIIMYVMFIVSLVLLIVPFFFVLPRLYLAPYFLIKNDCTVSEAVAASWHSTKGQASLVWGIFGINVALAILCITIIGIPFAIYWGIINSGSFALLTLYLSQSKATLAKVS